MSNYKKTVSVGSFLKKGVDLKNGDMVQIASEGKDVEGQFGIQHLFLLKLKDGKEGNVAFNQTTINGLVDAFGEDSINWIGKECRVWLIKSNVAGKFVDVLYISHPNYDLGDNGFVPKGKTNEEATVEYNDF